MKKLILVIVAIAITFGSYAQSDSKSKKMIAQDMNNDQDQMVQNNSVDPSHPDGVMMQNGKMMKVKNGEMTIIQDGDLTLNNGTKIMSDGTCIKKDGTKMMLKEGQHLDMSGNLIPMKTNTEENVDLNQNKAVESSHSEGVIMLDGVMRKVKNGQKTIMQEDDMTLSNGTKIMNDGTYIKKDGTKMMLKDGEQIDMDGNIIPSKTNKDNNMLRDSTEKKN